MDVKADMSRTKKHIEKGKFKRAENWKVAFDELYEGWKSYRLYCDRRNCDWGEFRKEVEDKKSKDHLKVELKNFEDE